MPESQRRGLLAGARTASGILGIGVAAAAIIVASVAPLPSLTTSRAPVSVTPVPLGQQLVCPGAVLRLGDESGANASSARPIGSPRSVAGATSGDVVRTPLAAGDASEAASPAIIAVPEADDDGTVTVAAAQAQTVDAGEVAGFAAADCTRPSSDTWIVGGSTATGRTALLALANPGTVISTVALELIGPDGVIEATGSSGIVVPARSQRVLSLAGFAPGVESFAIRVTSSGGPVAATLQQSVVRGIDAGGLDIVGAAGTPTTTTVIPGVVIQGAEEAGTLLGEEGFEDLATILRAYVPGEVPATGTVRLLSSDPAVAGGSFAIRLDAGVVSEIGLEELPDGIYTAIVETDEPVIAAIRASAVADGVVDLAWSTPATALSDSAVIAVADGPSPSLQLANTGTTESTVTVTSATGASEQVTVAPGAVAAVSVAGGSRYTLSGTDGLHGSVVFTGEAAIGGYPIAATAGVEPDVHVYLD